MRLAGPRVLLDCLAWAAHTPQRGLHSGSRAGTAGAGVAAVLPVGQQARAGREAARHVTRQQRAQAAATQPAKLASLPHSVSAAGPLRQRHGADGRVRPGHPRSQPELLAQASPWPQSQHRDRRRRATPFRLRCGGSSSGTSRRAYAAALLCAPVSTVAKRRAAASVRRRRNPAHFRTRSNATARRLPQSQHLPRPHACRVRAPTPRSSEELPNRSHSWMARAPAPYRS